MEYKTAEVLAEVMRERGISQADISRAVGTSHQAVQQWCAGKTAPRGRNLARLAEYLKLTPDVLLYGSAASKSAPTTVPTDDGYVSIPRLEIRGSCGSGYDNDGELPALVAMVSCSLAWLRLKVRRANFAHLQIITAHGDSMAPTINPEDFCFVDRSYEQIRDDGIYVLTYAGHTYIKRVQRLVDGSLTLLSDNPRYPPVAVPASMLGSVVVEGKCVLHCLAEEL